jgi:activator of HSP90 ATPase
LNRHLPLIGFRGPNAKKIFDLRETRTPLQSASQKEASAEDRSSEFAMSCTINASAKRIYQALIEPEYRELWMRMPGQDENGRILALKSQDLFRLDYHRFGRLDLSIFGSYQVCRCRRQLFSWWKNSPNSKVSLVEFRLEGSFSNSILRLNHRGLDAEAEYVWHSEMWRASLARLASMF